MRMKVNEAPYVVEYVRRQMLRSVTKERLLKGGLTIRTTFDLDFQKAAQDALAERLAPKRKPLATATETAARTGARLRR